MSLVTFQDLPNTTTPISAANLNNNFSYVSPTGGIMEFAGSTAPTGWLMCDGSAVSRTTYADLYAVIGTTYGTGDGSTTFNLPDLKGKVPVGYNSSDTSFDALGETGGEKTHQLSVSEMPSHTHEALYQVTGGYGDGGGSYNGKPMLRGNVTSASTVLWSTQSRGSSGYHNNLQPYIVLNYIIKY